MPAMRFAVAFLVASWASPVESVSVAANPIRKVVTLLQQMQKKVAEEGEKELELYNKYQCWCKTGAKDLAASIESAEAKIGDLTADIKESEENKAKTEEELKQHQADREEAIKAMAEAEAIREKEAAAFAKLSAEHGANAAAMMKAIKALERGMAGVFLQTHAADVLRNMAQGSSDVSTEDRQTLLSFLSGSSEYAPQSGQITGILKQMLDEMHAGFAEATEGEEDAISAHAQLMDAKTKQKNLASQAIEAKLAKVAELGVSIAQMKNDLGDTSEALEADRQFSSNLKEDCDKKAKEWEERSKLRAEELVALADTIKVLNDDDALELFKSTLPSARASFMQVQVGTASMRASARAAIAAGLKTGLRSDRPKLDAIFLAFRGKKIGFEKVLAMIDGMVATLKKEQQDDDSKKEYCMKSLDTSDDKKKELERKVSDLEAAMASAQETIATLTDEIAALTAGIKELDKTVAEATENRKAENEEFKQMIASNSAAKEVLLFAKNRLNQFYNPKLFKAPPKRELSAEDRIAVNMGGTAPPTAPPAGIAGTGITVFAQVSAHSQRKAAPPPPPETFGAYTTKSEENNGVVKMIGMLIEELDKEMNVAEAEEKDAQGDYETLMKDSAEKRAADSKSLAEKEAAKADTADALEKHTEDKTSVSKALAANNAFIASLHAECDWILQYHGVRKEARASEVDSLGKAKAVLSGADFSLLQTGNRGFLRRRS